MPFTLVLALGLALCLALPNGVRAQAAGGAASDGVDSTAAAEAPDRPELTGAAFWADSVRRAIHTANLAGDLAGIVQARALAERGLVRWPDDAWLLHYYGFALYREATIRQGREASDGDDIDDLLARAQEALEQSADLRSIPETHALRASVLGQRIAQSPMIRGITMGPRSNGAMDRAIEAGPENPRVWLVSGMSAIFKPGLFGGGLEPAEEDLRRAIELFANDDPEPPAPAWGHDEAWLWLGQVLARQERIDEARTAYENALEHEPGNTWVRDVLLPGLDSDGGTTPQ